MKRILTAIIAGLTIGACAFAGAKVAAPSAGSGEYADNLLPRLIMDTNAAPARTPDGAALTLELPLKAINQLMASVVSGNTSLINPNEPILQANGKKVLIQNINVAGEHPARPRVILLPYFAGKNTLALKVEKFQLKPSGVVDSIFAPIVADKKQILADAVNAMIGSISQYLATTGDGQMKDLVSMTYDADKMLLLASFSPKFITPFAGDVAITGFSFTNQNFIINMNNGTDLLAGHPAYNLVLGDAVINKSVKKMSSSAFDMSVTPGGIAFSEKGVSLSAKADTGKKLPGLLGGAQIYAHFTANCTVTLPQPDTFRLSVEQLRIHKVYGGSKPLTSVPGWLQDYLQSGLVNSALKGLSENAEMAKYAEIKQLDGKTITLKFKKGSFLPAFSNITLDKFKTDGGHVYFHINTGN